MKSKVFFLSFAFAIALTLGVAQAHEGGFETQEDVDQDELVALFAHDLQSGLVPKISNLAIRHSNHQRVELKISTELMTNPQLRVIHCLACRKDSVSSDEMKRLAKITGVKQFLDFNYTTTDQSQILSMTIVSADSEKPIWHEVYSHYENQGKISIKSDASNSSEPFESSVEVIRAAQLKLQFAGLAIPQKTSGLRAAFGVGLQVQYRGFGIESNFYQVPVFDYEFNLLLLKFLNVGTLNQIWFGAGANYARDSGTGSASPTFRAGYDWHLGPKYVLSPFFGGNTAQPFDGIEAGLNLGYRF